MNKVINGSLAALMIAILSNLFISCDKESSLDSSKNNISETLMNYKWVAQSTEYNEYSYGSAIYTQTWTVYFINESQGVIHWKAVDRDSDLGTYKYEEDIEFYYRISDNMIYLSGGSNFEFVFCDSYLMDGNSVFDSKPMDSSDYSYLQSFKGGNSGGSGIDGGPIDTQLFVINDSEIFQGANYWEDGIYVYNMQLGFGAMSDDAFKKGMTQIRATVWVDNGCIGTYSSANIGKKKVYTLYLSPTQYECYEWIIVNAKAKEITFHYKLEYLNSKDGQYYEVLTRSLTFNAT